MDTKEHQLAQSMEWIKNAQLWIKKSRTYGDDMRSSADKCIVDAEVCLKYAIGYSSGELVGADSTQMLEYLKK
jgi:hypothetical protein